ncbi:hypothetical protein [Desulfatibacillum aliphaticivorans]|uniref:hypothetical protein n=1 Tax=Desulfatibacillum aliphaticivorans TaxID=218208 RepID=UPI000412F21F|nr:hypothetical protein [Desulfatibacillum aliphaticivorans]
MKEKTIAFNHQPGTEVTTAASQLADALARSMMEHPDVKSLNLDDDLPLHIKDIHWDASGDRGALLAFEANCTVKGQTKTKELMVMLEVFVTTREEKDNEN